MIHEIVEILLVGVVFGTIGGLIAAAFDWFAHHD